MKRQKRHKKLINLDTTSFDKKRLIMTIGAFLLIFFFGVSLLRNIAAVSKAKRTIEERRAAVEELKQENERLEKVLVETNSQEFIEKQIRDKLGLAKTGEVVVVLPDEEILESLAPDIPKDTPTLPLTNWQKWYGLFF